jgi:uncharacterized protein GlcG (DUF336 family)
MNRQQPNRRSKSAWIASRLALLLALAFVVTSYRSGASPQGPRGPRRGPAPSASGCPASAILTHCDVQDVIAATTAAIGSSSMAIAVTDRQGDVLGVYVQPDAPVTSIGNFSQPVKTADLAVGLARTASFFSNDEAPLSSRTVRFISGIHFPPGIMFTGNAALYGIENTNRGCGFNVAFNPGLDVPKATMLDGSIPGTGVVTGKKDVFDSDPNAVNPGGIPLFKNGVIVGGVGVAGIPANVAEYAALVGSLTGNSNFGNPNQLPLSIPFPGYVVIGGVKLPFDAQPRPLVIPAGYGPGSSTLDPTLFTVAPIDSPKPAPECYLAGPKAGSIGGLSQADVAGIVQVGIDLANQTSAVIRLPLGSPARFVIAVSDLDGSLLALYRMVDATIFSIDVAVGKARNVIYFTGPTRLASDLPGVPMNTAVTNRTISFGAQPFYPPGIDYAAPGPFFPLYQFDTAHACTQGADTSHPENFNGIVFFPGAVPLYRNGVMVGGLGISGDGVDQDDFVTNGAAVNFLAPLNIRADQINDQGVRLPYQKYPRNPTTGTDLSRGQFTCPLGSGRAASVQRRSRPRREATESRRAGL